MNNEHTNDNNNLYDNIINNLAKPPPPVPPPRTTSTSSSSSSSSSSTSSIQQQQQEHSFLQTTSLPQELQSAIYSSSSLLSVPFSILTNNKTTNKLNNNQNYNLNKRENDCNEAENIKKAANLNNRDNNYLIFNNNNNNDNSSNLVKGSFFIDDDNTSSKYINETLNISGLSSTTSSYLLLNATNKNNSFLSNTNTNNNNNNYYYNYDNNNKKSTINTNDEETEIQQSIDNLNYNDLLNNINTTINSKLTFNNRNSNPINNSSIFKTKTKITPLFQSEINQKNNISNNNKLSTKIKSKKKDKKESLQNEKIIDLTDTSSSSSLNIYPDTNNNTSDIEMNKMNNLTTKIEPIEIHVQNDLPGSSSFRSSSREFLKQLASAGLSSPSSFSINETPLRALNQSRFLSSSTSLPRREKSKSIESKSRSREDNTNSVPIRIERESNSTHSISAIPSDLLDNESFHCSMPNCNCRRYSAADIISFNIPPSSALRNSNDHEHSSSVLLSTFPNKSTPKTVNVIKKLSNLKRNNCGRLKQNEKVKFSDIELRHLIVDPNGSNKEENEEIEEMKKLDNESSAFPILHPIYVEPKFKSLKQSMSTAELKNLNKKSSMKHSNTVNVLDMNRLCNSRRSRDMYDYDQDSDDHYYYYDDEYDYEDEAETYLKPITSLNRRLAKQIYVDKCGNYYYNYCLKPVHYNHSMRFRRKVDSSESDFETYNSNTNYRKFYNEKLFNRFVDEQEFSNRKSSHHRSNNRHQRSSSTNHHQHHQHHRSNKSRHKSQQVNQTSSLNYPSNKSKQVKINEETKLISNSNSCVYPLSKEEEKKITEEKFDANSSKITGSTNNLVSTNSNTNTNTNTHSPLTVNSNTNQVSQILPQLPKPIDQKAPSQSLEQLTMNKLKQQIIGQNNPLSPEQLMTRTIGNNYSKPTSKAQLTRMISSNRDKEIDTTVYSNKYQDLIAENASFIDSPIHLLMNHHVNQRMIKLKNKKKSDLSDINEIYEKTKPNLQPKIVDNLGKEILKVNETDVITIELKGDIIKTEQMTQLPLENTNDQVFTYEYTEKKEEPIKVENTAYKKRNSHKTKIFYAILMTSVITYSSVFLLELVSCLIRLDNTNLMAFKFSSFILTFGYVLLIGRKSKNMNENKNYYNLFNPTQIDQTNSSNKSNEELQAISSITQQIKPPNDENEPKRLRLKSNFYMILISLLLINFWVLSTYLFSYLFSSSSSLNATYYFLKSNNKFSNIMETVSACIGGFGVSLFFRNIIHYLYEYNLCTSEFDTKKSNITPNQTNSFNSLILNIEKRAQALDCFKKILLKYFVAIQSHWLLTICFFVYTIYVTGDNSVNSILHQLCLESIVNVTKFKVCPQSLITNEFFSWKNEIQYRKSVTSNLPKTNSFTQSSQISQSIQNTNNILSLQGLFQTVDKNQTDSTNFKSSNYNYSDDIYLLMISVSLINFFVSIIIPVSFIKSNRRFRKMVKLNEENTSEFENLTIQNKSESEKTKSPNHRILSKIALLHLMVPLIFFHGFSKTILLCELNKWYVSCLNGINHLISLLITYGVCSLISIIILTLLMVICNYKRKILFFLAFVQQLTLIILLLFWDPAKSFDFKVYYIDHIFFMCLAICDNLWLIHNIKTLVEKAHDLNKSPSILLVYGYGMYCLGGFIGYALSIYFCTLIKLNLTLLLLVLLSTIYIVSESVFFLTRNI